MDRNEALIAAARNVVWKLSHNFNQADYRGPARIDRRDATIRDLVAALDAMDAK